MIPLGREFYKMSGSGNDFVFVDTRSEPAGPLATPEVIGSICSRGTGIGADGVCFLETSQSASIRLVYLNADGSRADLCGNATLCTARLARELAVVPGNTEFTIETDSGVLTARFDGDRPEIDLKPVREVRPEAGISLAAGEQRMGFALAGVPHLVVLVDDLDRVDVVGRGRPLRRDRTLKAGANVNFVQPRDGVVAYRTYERGVEAETLACGTGAVATAVLMAGWDLTDPRQVVVRTRSGRELRVRLSPAPQGGQTPSLSGEARVVAVGRLAEIQGLNGPVTGCRGSVYRDSHVLHRMPTGGVYITHLICPWPRSVGALRGV